jgi:hypothetical protein
MAIVGDQPATGFRVSLTRRGDEAPYAYAGEIALPGETRALEAVFLASGEVTLEIEGGAPPALVEKVRLLLRTIFKNARAEDPDAPPPRAIARWRGEK